MYPGSRSLRLPPPPLLLSIPGLMILEPFLNRLLADAIRAGELDFLKSRRVRIHITNVSFSFDIGFSRQRINLGHSVAEADLCVRGESYDFLLLASRREDADTLFFQRRLQTEGDTELGLEVKNFLDGRDLSNQPLQRFVQSGLANLLRGIEFLRPPPDESAP